MHWLPRKTVIVPVDFSDDSLAAIDTAHEMVDDPSHLHVIHVLPNMEANDPGVIWQTIDDSSRRQHAEEALHRVLQQRGLPAVEVVVRFGDPGQQIAKYAQEAEAGLIVISSHGKSAWEHLLIGSVAERVVRLAHCPVLVLKQ